MSVSKWRYIWVVFLVYVGEAGESEVDWVTRVHEDKWEDDVISCGGTQGDIFSPLQFALVSQQWHGNDDKSLSGKQVVTPSASEICFMVQWRWKMKRLGCWAFANHQTKPANDADKHSAISCFFGQSTYPSQQNGTANHMHSIWQTSALRIK